MRANHHFRCSAPVPRLNFPCRSPAAPPVRAPRLLPMPRPALAVLLLALPASAADAPDFLREVEPVLTKTGCNQGSCHGKGLGQNGFKLSLRGFDPAADHKSLNPRVRRPADRPRRPRQEPAREQARRDRATRGGPHLRHRQPRVRHAGEVGGSGLPRPGRQGGEDHQASRDPRRRGDEAGRQAAAHRHRHLRRRHPGRRDVADQVRHQRRGRVPRDPGGGGHGQADGGHGRARRLPHRSGGVHGGGAVGQAGGRGQVRGGGTTRSTTACSPSSKNSASSRAS